MQVIHADRQPEVFPLAPHTLRPDLVRIDPPVAQKFAVSSPFVVDAAIIVARLVDSAPDRLPRFRIEASTLSARTEHVVRNATFLQHIVHALEKAFLRHRFRRPVEELVVVHIYEHRSLPGSHGGDAGHCKDHKQQIAHCQYPIYQRKEITVPKCGLTVSTSRLSSFARVHL